MKMLKWAQRGIAALSTMAISAPAFAQEFGNLQYVNRWLDWLTGPVAIIIVAVALVGAIAYGVYRRDIAEGAVAFIAVLVLGCLFGMVIDIATAVVNV